MFAPTLAPRNFTAAMRDLTHEKAQVRAAAARDLRFHAQERRSETVRALAAALADEAAPVRAAAAETLAEVRGEEALAALMRLVDEDEDSSSRQMALMALGAIADPRAGEVLHRALEDDAPAVRFQAVIAVARSVEQKPAVAALLAATTDDDPLVRHIALRMSEELGDAQQVVDPQIVARCQELLADEDAIVRVAAAIIRARAAERDGIPLLVDVVRGTLLTSQAEDEAAAIELCGELRVREAAEPLLARAFSGRLGTGADRFSWHARVALAQLGNDRAIRWILAEFGAFTRERRTLAVAAAARAKLSAARPLIEAMRGDPSRADPDAVEDALREL